MREEEAWGEVREEEVRDRRGGMAGGVGGCEGGGGGIREAYGGMHSASVMFSFFLPPPSLSPPPLPLHLGSASSN